MRATTLTSVAVLALLWQSQLCAAETKPPVASTQAASKSEAGLSKKSASRLGSLSPDEARRAARAHARAAAALKKTDPVRAAAAADKASGPKKPDLAKAAEPPKTVETAKANEAVKSSGAAKSTAMSEPSKTATPESVASRPAATVDHVAAQPDPVGVTTTGRSASIDSDGNAARATKRAMRTAERDRKRNARREARRRTRDRFADDQGPTPSRFYRADPYDQRFAADGGGYGERIVVAPQAQYRYIPGPAYPPYPQPYGGEGY